MAKKRKVWPPKFKSPTTSISRLGKYTHPIKMIGDPPWSNWNDRCHKVYAYEMERKRSMTVSDLHKALAA